MQKKSPGMTFGNILCKCVRDNDDDPLVFEEPKKDKFAMEFEAQDRHLIVFWLNKLTIVFSSPQTHGNG
jgi:hypothetical protein